MLSVIFPNFASKHLQLLFIYYVVIKLFGIIFNSRWQLEVVPAKHFGIRMPTRVRTW